MITNNEKDALNRAIDYANDCTIGLAGVTKDNFIVLNQECISYRKSIDDLKYEVNGNWSLERTSKSSCWKQFAPPKITQYF